jgi:hypothetical protein
VGIEPFFIHVNYGDIVFLLNLQVHAASSVFPPGGERY